MQPVFYSPLFFPRKVLTRVSVVVLISLVSCFGASAAAIGLVRVCRFRLIPRASRPGDQWECVSQCRLIKAVGFSTSCGVSSALSKTFSGFSYSLFSTSQATI